MYFIIVYTPPKNCMNIKLTLSVFLTFVFCQSLNSYTFIALIKPKANNITQNNLQEFCINDYALCLEQNTATTTVPQETALNLMPEEQKAANTYLIAEGLTKKPKKELHDLSASVSKAIKTNIKNLTTPILGSSAPENTKETVFETDKVRTYSFTVPTISRYYNQMLVDISQHRKYLSDSYKFATNSFEKEQILKDAQDFFVTSLTENILPKWYGTPWNFYGHCDAPHQGTIACGYLVSTALKHLGVNVDRFGLAQQWPQNIVESLVSSHNTLLLGGKQQVLNQVQNLGYGVYIVGLSHHVGFIKYDQTGMQFIHSNWAGSKTVTSEDPEYSVAFADTPYYYLGKISSEEFMLKWLNYTRLSVIKG